MQVGRFPLYEGPLIGNIIKGLPQSLLMTVGGGRIPRLGFLWGAGGGGRGAINLA